MGRDLALDPRPSGLGYQWTFSFSPWAPWRLGEESAISLPGAAFARANKPKP
jgi:hypothetical protein